MRPPNLLVLLPDQQRTDTIACYGGTEVHAPALNKLASESVIFERAYVTQPICTPSRASLLSGLWPHTTGCTRNSVFLPSPNYSRIKIITVLTWASGISAEMPPLNAAFAIGFRLKM